MIFFRKVRTGLGGGHWHWPLSVFFSALPSNANEVACMGGTPVRCRDVRRCWATQVIANSRALGAALTQRGYNLVTGGTG